MEDLEVKLDSLSTQVEDLVKLSFDQKGEEGLLAKNRLFCRLYCDLQLLRQDIEVHIESDQNKSFDHLITKIDTLSSKLSLVSIKMRSKLTIFSAVDYIVRGLGVFLTFIPIGMFGSLVVLFLRWTDSLFSSNVKYSDVARRFIAHLFLWIAGIKLRVEGNSAEKFGSGCSLLTFSHASNLDGFVIAATCPVRHVAFGKKELFYVPFFSWISLALGGVPVDRQNRDRAIRTLQRSAECVTRVASGCEKSGEPCCLVISPEGTRSLSGQLLPFKKGPFHIWDTLKSPIVPMLIIGAYDLYPVKNLVNDTGLVVVRYLDPILPSEATTKDEMMTLLRRRMLESLRNSPADTGRSLTFSERSVRFLVSLMAIVFDIASFYWLKAFCYEYLLLDGTQALLYGFIVSCLITVVLYVYFVYIIDKQKVSDDFLAQKSKLHHE